MARASAGRGRCSTWLSTLPSSRSAGRGTAIWASSGASAVRIVKKSGACYTYEGDQMGQGRENAKAFLSDSLEVMIEISEKIRQKVGIGGPENDVPLGQAPGDDDPI